MNRQASEDRWMWLPGERHRTGVRSRPKQAWHRRLLVEGLENRELLNGDACSWELAATATGHAAEVAGGESITAQQQSAIGPWNAKSQGSFGEALFAEFNTNGVEWQAFHDLTSQAFQAKFDELLPLGFRLVDISGYQQGNAARYAGVWIKQTGPALQARHGLTEAEYIQTFNSLAGQNYRMVDIDVFTVNGTEFFNMIWEQPTVVPQWQAHHDLTSAEYQSKFNEYFNDGYRLLRVSGYESGGVSKYAAIWEKTSGPNWLSKHRIPANEYQQEFNARLSEGYRLVDINAYTVGSSTFFAAIWHQTDGTAWYARHGLSSAEYQVEFDRLRSLGYRLEKVNGARGDAQPEFAAIWVAGSAVNQNVFLSPTTLSLTEGDSGTRLFTFDVQRTGNTTGVATVDYRVAGVTANPANAADFVGGNLPQGTLTFAAGITARTITIQVAGDTDFESDDVFEVTLENPSTGVLIVPGAARGVIVNDDADADVLIVDNDDQGFARTSGWGTATGAGFGSDYNYSPANYGNWASWSFTVQPGTYKVSATWIGQSILATNASFQILDGSTQIGTDVLNQTLAPDDFSDRGSNWENLGTFVVTSTELRVRLTDTASNFVIADAMRIERIADTQIVDDGDADFATVGGWGYSDSAGYAGDYRYSPNGFGHIATWTFDVLPGAYRVYTTWRAQGILATNAPFTILDGSSVVGVRSVDQTRTPDSFNDGTTAWHKLGVFVISGNQLQVRLADTASSFVVADAVRIERIPEVQRIDDGDVGFSTVGGWGYWDQAGFQGDYHYSQANTGSTATWSFDVQPGAYKVAATWVNHGNHANNARLTVSAGFSPLATKIVNQTQPPDDFSDALGTWENLGTYQISGNSLNVTLTDIASSFVVADAVRIERILDVQIVDDGQAAFSTSGGWGYWNQAGYGGDYHYAFPNAGNTAVWTFDVLPGTYEVSATWQAGTNHASNAMFSVVDGVITRGQVSVNQRQAPNDFSELGTSWERLGFFQATSHTLTVMLTDTANAAVIADAIRLRRL